MPWLQLPSLSNTCIYPPLKHLPENTYLHPNTLTQSGYDPTDALRHTLTHISIPGLTPIPPMIPSRDIRSAPVTTGRTYAHTPHTLPGTVLYTLVPIISRAVGRVITKELYQMKAIRLPQQSETSIASADSSHRIPSPLSLFCVRRYSGKILNNSARFAGRKILKLPNRGGDPVSLNDKRNFNGFTALARY